MTAEDTLAVASDLWGTPGGRCLRMGDYVAVTGPEGLSRNLNFDWSEVRGSDIAGPRNQGNQGLPRHPREPLVLLANALLTARPEAGRPRRRT